MHCNNKLKNYYYLERAGFEYIKYSEKAFLFSKHIVIFGAGGKGIEVTKELDQFNLEPSYFIDNDPKKWGTTFQEKEVKNPKIVLQGLDNTLIIIASQYAKEITEQLIHMGLTKNKHFFSSWMSINVLF